jgi:putative flippase GtrA
MHAITKLNLTNHTLSFIYTAYFMKILNIEINRETVFEFTKFVLVGCLNTGMAFVTFFLLTHFAGINDNVSNVISYIIGLINSFIWNRNWTFKKKDTELLKYELFFFIIFFLISFALQMSVYTILKNNLNVRIYTTVKDNLEARMYISYFIGMMFYTGTNFIFNKLLTFNLNNLTKIITLIKKMKRSKKKA